MSKSEYLVLLRLTPHRLLKVYYLIVPFGIYLHASCGLSCGEEVPGDSGQMSAFIG